MNLKVTISYIHTAIYKFSYYLIIIPLYFWSLFPLSWLYGISRAMVWIIFRVFRYRHNVIARNLKIVFLDSGEDFRRGIEDEFILHFADITAEFIKGFSMSAEEFRQRFDIQPSDEMISHFHNNRDIFIAGAHINNWEWAVITAGDQIPARTVAIYKPLANRAMNQILINVREKIKTRMIPMGLVLRDILTKDRPATSFVFLSDQSTPFSITSHWTEFFGIRTPFVSGMSTMAVRNNIPIYYFNIEKVKRGYYKARFSMLVKDPGQHTPEEITALYCKKLTENILNQPASWLWTHKRWKRVIQY